VINIITKRSQDTTGWLVDTPCRHRNGKAGLALRYGMKTEDGSAFRVTVNEQRRDGARKPPARRHRISGTTAR